jgi:hypothetical protein
MVNRTVWESFMFRIEPGCLADYFGKPLRDRYDPSLSEPIPKRFLDLLDELQRRESDSQSFTDVAAQRRPRSPHPGQRDETTKKRSDEAGGKSGLHRRRGSHLGVTAMRGVA